tara:strand:- start:1662 stop:2366 length:705 start_codon:yes stop_codon:yes gene_type:complete
MALQNDTLADLKNLTFALIGREYADTTASFGRLKALWNYAAKKAYRQTNYWERFLVIGDERTVVNGNEIPRDAAGKDSIDTYLRLYQHNPNTTRGPIYPFIVKGSGATLTGNASNVPSNGLFVSNSGEGFYLQPNDSSTDTKIFATYKKAYDPDYGNAGDAEAIPAELLPYMAHLTAYTWQRSVEQNSDESNFSLSLALVNSILEDELAKISDQGIANSYLVKNIKTNYNQLII